MMVQKVSVWISDNYHLARALFLLLVVGVLIESEACPNFLRINCATPALLELVSKSSPRFLFI